MIHLLGDFKKNATTKNEIFLNSKIQNKQDIILVVKFYYGYVHKYQPNFSPVVDIWYKCYL